MGWLALRRRGAAACLAVVPHAAWCCRLATPRPSGRVLSGASAPTRRRTEMRFHEHTFKAPDCCVRRTLRVFVRDPVAALVSLMLRPDVEPALCLSGLAAAARPTAGSRWPSALLTVVPVVPVPGCVREDGGVSKPCEGAVFHQAVEQDGGVVGEAHPRRAPLAFAVYSDKTTKPQCVQRVQCPVPTLCGLIAAAGTSRMQKPHRWQGMARVRAA